MTTDRPKSLHTKPRYPDGWNVATATLNKRRGWAPAAGRRRRAAAAITAGMLLGAGSACRGGGNGGSAQAGAVGQASQAPQSAGKSGDTLTTRMDLARILGDSSARVWFIIASDFQCPYCKQFHDQSFAALRDEYVSTGKVRMAYINYPLPIHANAWPTAEAAMCAGAQGKFWQMHDGLFAAQARWEDKHPPTAVLDSVAHAIGVDTTAMNACMTSPAVHALIEADRDRAEQSGVNATPTIIIGRSVMPGVAPIQNYRRALDSALAGSR